MGENKEKDVTDLLLNKLKDFAILIVTTIIDCLEESFNCMTYVGGKNLKWVLLIVFSFIPVTILLTILKLNTFIPWQDATIAFIVMLLIYGINNITRDSVEKSMFKVKGAMNSIKERRHVKDAGQ